MSYERSPRWVCSTTKGIGTYGMFTPQTVGPWTFRPLAGPSGPRSGEIGLREQERKRLVLSQPAAEGLERLVTLERLPDLLGGLLELACQLLDVLLHLGLGHFQLLLLGDGLQEQEALHLQHRSGAQIVPHSFDVEAELPGVHAAPLEALDRKSV